MCYSRVYQAVLWASLVVIFNFHPSHSMEYSYEYPLNSNSIFERPLPGSNYIRRGRMGNVAGVPAYFAGANPPRESIIILIHDIFGILDNIMHGADMLAEACACTVVIPDTFRGKPWLPKNVDPNNNAPIREWLDKVGKWEQAVKPDIDALMNFYRKSGVTQWAIVGYCFGGYNAYRAAVDYSPHELQAAVAIHPSFPDFLAANPQAVRVPLYLMPAIGDPDMVSFWKILQKNLGPENTGHIRFTNQKHGFGGAKGNWSNRDTWNAVLTVIYTAVEFIEKEFAKAMAPPTVLPTKSATPVPGTSYKARGKVIAVNNVPVYYTGPDPPKVIIFDIYDIFGFHINTFRVADMLAQRTGITVLMPDIFRGKPWDINYWPVKDFQEVLKWLEEIGTWENHVRPDLDTLLQYYRNNFGVKCFGVIGFCFGGFQAYMASTSYTKDTMVAGVAVHPASFNFAKPEKVQIPFYLMPSKDEPENLDKFVDVLKNRLGADHTGYTKFGEWFHGFAGARGNFSNPRNVAAIEKVVELATGFLTRQLNECSMGKYIY